MPNTVRGRVLLWDVFLAPIRYFASVCKLAGEQDIALSAPVRMTLRASATVASNLVPSCVYYNEGTGSWDTAGLAMDSIATWMDEGDDGNGWMDVNVTCLSLHLSDFTISSDDVDAAFRPVTLVSKQPPKHFKLCPFMLET